MGKLDGKTAIITGGASGIGAGTVRLFVEQGANVVIADIQDDRGEALAQELGATAAYCHTDVTREDDIKAVVEMAVGKFGRLDVMFNNAGIPGNTDSLFDQSADHFDEMVAVMLRGVFLGTKHAARAMLKNKSGSIINTSSVAGLQAGHAGHIYTTCKHGVIGLTRTTAMELGEMGIRVNAICPGGIATPIFGRGMGLDSDMAERTVDFMKGVLANVQPIRRSGLPVDIAQAALWLASDDSSFVNAAALVVDGGLTGGTSWSRMNEMNMQFAQTFMETMMQGNGEG
jgi:NAD(P)-dependent dehydrogenase (short-subunit alcohol dehydrogenase family)